MSPPRRSVLASAAALTTLAGCLDLSGDDDGPTPLGTADTPEGAVGFSFGETAVFTDDQGTELEVTMSDPRLQETVTVVRDAELYVDSPAETRYFLFADVELANTGSAPVRAPRGLYFEADGEAVQRAAIRVPGRRYRDVDELAPGEDATATVAFPAPAEATTATVELRFTGPIDSPPARWTLAYGDVSTKTTDLTRDGLGTPVTVEAGDHGYSFTPTAVETTTAYTDDDGQEHAAPDGRQFVLLSVRAESVGSAPTKLPTPFTVRLGVGDSLVRSSPYKRASAAYPGRVDPTPPGESLSGVLLYETARDVRSARVSLAVGNETSVTWPVSLPPADSTPTA